jgi:hypothetical protein
MSAGMPFPGLPWAIRPRTRPPTIWRVMPGRSSSLSEPGSRSTDWRRPGRSPGHAHHVACGNAVDGKDGAWKEAPRPLSRSPRGIPLGRVRRKDFAPAGIKRVPRMTGAKNGYPLLEDGTVLNVSADPQRPSHSRSGHRRVGSRSLFHGASLPLLAELGAGGRRGPGCREHRQPHRFHTAGRKSRALWPAREPPGGNMQSWFAPLLLTICIANRALQLFALSQRPTSWSPPIRAEPM